MMVRNYANRGIEYNPVRKIASTDYRKDIY